MDSVSYEPCGCLINFHYYVCSNLIIRCRGQAPSVAAFLLGISIISPTVHHNQIAGMGEFYPKAGRRTMALNWVCAIWYDSCSRGTAGTR